MKSKQNCTRSTRLAILGLMVLLAGPACSQTASRPMPITTGDGGWEHVYNLPQGTWICGLFFLDNKTGWAVGGSRLILKTTNGGATWSPQNSGMRDAILSCVCFADANNGWVVANVIRPKATGFVLRTTDGGVTWHSQKALDGGELKALCFADSKTGWAVGSVAGPAEGKLPTFVCRVLKTTDGGITWAAVSDPPLGGSNVRAAVFTDALNGCVFGSRGVARTVDGGQTWLKPAKMPELSNHSVDAACFTDRNHGWTCGLTRSGGVIRRTTDGGDSWTEYKIGTKTWFRSIYFADSKNGWVVGGGGTILRTTDGGETWEECPSGIKDQTLLAVQFADARNGWAAGWDGTMLRTTDGGKTWVQPQQRSLRAFFSAQFVDPLTGWVTGEEGGILKTTDGGLTWVQQRANCNEALTGLSFADARNGWAVGRNGVVLVTSDGGGTWVRRSSWLQGLSDKRTRALRARCIDGKSGWILAQDSSDEKSLQCALCRTEDGGITWERLSTGTMSPVWDIWFVSRMAGWEVGAGGLIMKTSDGGKTWRRQFAGVAQDLRAVCFLDSRVGWAVGEDGVIVKTVDGGETWTRQESGVKDVLLQVRFIDATTGWASAMHSALKTTDGGETWKKQDTGCGAGSGWDLCFVDSDHGWIPGFSLLRTTTSGLPGCVWTKNQPDGKPANFGHLVVTETTSDGLYAVHPDSKIGIRFRIKDTTAKVGDYIYIHGKIASDGAEKAIDAESIDVITSGWGVIKENNSEKQARSH